APSVPSGWVWLVILGMAVFMLWMMGELTSNSTIDFSDFLKLADAKKLNKVALVGADRIVGEVKDTNDLPNTIKDPEALRKRLHGGKFTTLKPERYEPHVLIEELRKDPDLVITQEPERGAWVGPVLLMLLPAVLLLGV